MSEVRVVYTRDEVGKIIADHARKSMDGQHDAHVILRSDGAVVKLNKAEDDAGTEDNDGVG